MGLSYCRPGYSSAMYPACRVRVQTQNYTPPRNPDIVNGSLPFRKKFLSLTSGMGSN
jgi:hypothetical protein